MRSDFWKKAEVTRMVANELLIFASKLDMVLSLLWQRGEQTVSDDGDKT
jgi:hypothetical protein